MSASDLSSLVGERVCVHLNLTTKKWSVALKPKGRKLGSASTVVLADVEFRVSEAQRRYCVEKGARFVHAWVIGTLVSVDGPVDVRGATCVTYNPFRAPTFHVRGEECPVYSAERLTLAAQYGWVMA